MKSPVFSNSRGGKSKSYRGKMQPSAGSIKMNGKLTKRTRCGCCTCFDFRQKMIDNYTKSDIDDATNKQGEYK